HVVEEDLRLVLSVGRREPHPASALGAHGPHMSLKTVLACKRGAVVAHRHGEEMELDVREADSRTAANEPARLEMIGGAEAIVQQQPARANQCPTPGVLILVERDRLATGDLEIEL